MSFVVLKNTVNELHGHVVVFDVLTEKFPYRRLGVTVSKRYGNAVARNRFKRLIREAFRIQQYRLPPGLIIHVSPRSNDSMPTFQEILEDFTPTLC